MKQTAVLYIHGKNGSAAECERYTPLFPECEVIGLDYQTFTPWETGAHIRFAEHNRRIIRNQTRRKADSLNCPP
ncbi:MAG: hypothetical protein UFA98_13065 [Ruminococcus sp.]|nr:hypothetical protein [Ruminococcus sp.]